MLTLVLQQIRLTSTECAQLGEIIIGRPLMDISINCLLHVTMLRPWSAKPATQTSTSKWGAEKSTTSPSSAISCSGWKALKWSSPMVQWLSMSRRKLTLEQPLMWPLLLLGCERFGAWWKSFGCVVLKRYLQEVVLPPLPIAVLLQ